MPDSKDQFSQNLNALAREACDLWQEHLASYAADPKGKAELMRLMEPTRRLFAEWAGMMQHGPYAELFGQSATPGGKGGSKAGGHGRQKPAGAAGSAAFGAASGGGDVDVAQLAARVAELEDKLAWFEGRSAAAPDGSPKKTRS